MGYLLIKDIKTPKPRSMINLFSKTGAVMKVLIAGAGKVTREILRRLGETWQVTLVDITPDRLLHLEKDFPQVVRTVLGDASSSLVLREAGLTESHFVVAATNRDDVNLEVCRQARERGPENIVAMVNDSSNLPAFEDLGVRVVCWSYLAAREIQLYLESPNLLVTTVGQGKGEVLEIKVPPTAPVVGRRVRELSARNWLVAAIYRGGELIIPHGDTVIEAGDRAVFIGHSDLYRAIAQLFSHREPAFPLLYGQKLLVVLRGKGELSLLKEATYLLKNTRAQAVALLMFKETQRELDLEIQNLLGATEYEVLTLEGDLVEELARLSLRQSIGSVLLWPPAKGLWSRILGPWAIIPLAHQLACPLWICRQSHPYRRILVPYNATSRASLALELAIDLARQLKAEVSVVTVAEPTFIAGPESRRWAKEALDRAQETARILQFAIDVILLEGNPVKEVIRLARDFDLLVLGSSTREVPFLRPHIREAIVRRSPITTVVVAS